MDWNATRAEPEPGPGQHMYSPALDFNTSWASWLAAFCTATYRTGEASARSVCFGNRKQPNKLLRSVWETSPFRLQHKGNTYVNVSIRGSVLQAVSVTVSVTGLFRNRHDGSSLRKKSRKLLRSLKVTEIKMKLSTNFEVSQVTIFCGRCWVTRPIIQRCVLQT